MAKWEWLTIPKEAYQILLTVPSDDYITKKIREFDDNEASNSIQQNYIHRARIGCVMGLYERYGKPKTFAEFYRIYTTDGSHGTFNKHKLTGGENFGRSIEELYNLAVAYYSELESDKRAASLNYTLTDCYWNIVAHALLQTMAGALFEDEVVAFYKRFGLSTYKVQGDLDVNGGVDLICRFSDRNDPFRIFEQTKPMTTFKSVKPRVITDRQMFYAKQEWVKDGFIEDNINPSLFRKTIFMVYDKRHVNWMFDRKFLLNKNGTPFFYLEELSDKDGNIILSDDGRKLVDTLPSIRLCDFDVSAFDIRNLYSIMDQNLANSKNCCIFAQK